MVLKGLSFFDKVHILIGVNANKKRTYDSELKKNIAEANKVINPNLEYVYFRAENVAVSSSMVKELNGYGKDVSKFIPKPALEVMKKQD